MNKTVFWEWCKATEELVISTEMVVDGEHKAFHKVQLPREQAVEMIKELHNDLEFEEYYDMYCHKTELNGG